MISGLTTPENVRSALVRDVMISMHHRQRVILFLLTVFSHVTSSTTDVTNKPPRAVKTLNDVIVPAPAVAGNRPRDVQKAMTSARFVNGKGRAASIPSILLDPLNEILEEQEAESEAEELKVDQVPVGKPDLFHALTDNMADLRPVPVELFHTKLPHSKTYRDVLRLFHRLGHALTDDEVDDIITSYQGTAAGQSFLSPWQRMARTGHVVESAAAGGYDSGEHVLVDWHAAFKHMHDVEAKMDCQLPRAEMFDVRSLPHEAHVDLLPHCTILHRCRPQYGCCADAGTECTVKRTEIITKAFFAIEHVMMDNNYYQPLPTVKTLTLVNHTECECQPALSVPHSRCQACPRPFSLSVRVDSCVCQCKDDKTLDECLNIASGRLPLADAQITCIEERRCELPACNYGQFNTRRRYCPCGSDCKQPTISSDDSLPEGSGEPDEELRLPEQEDYSYTEDYDANYIIA